MIIYGKNPIKEALKNPKNISKIYVQKGIRDIDNIISIANKNNIKISLSDKFLLDKISSNARHQGLVAEVVDFEYSSVEEIISYAKDRGEKLLLLILDGIEDPHNLGSILRVAECSGVHGVIIPKHRACAVNDTVVKVSCGASEYVKVAMVTNINDTIRELKDNFVSVFCADMGDTPMYKQNMKDDTAIVIGSEGFGVKALTKKLCDGVVSIPMQGNINSLNASVACGIVVYEAVRQRNN